MIVTAVLPLVAEHGAAVTTSQIARAAGIGEGTIFRAFKDKEELIDECIAEALRPDGVLDVLADIPLDQPLDRKLVEAAGAMSAHLDRIGAVLGAVAVGKRMHRKLPEGDDLEKSVDARQRSFTLMNEAIAELFDPEQERLRAPAEELAALFVALMFTRTRAGGLSDVDKMVDVFLHGAVEAG
ncbi:TetR/AcrR family transcriptional regulator [Amycolatopsis minnesotensis]|uniref:TetR/AcrR family transcriptional regulator n=2 Tax=Amycolatopsis minnesotensis TaxID=337894 RepID=A0ABP5CXA4_9PSEU